MLMAAALSLLPARHLRSIPVPSRAAHARAAAPIGAPATSSAATTRSSLGFSAWVESFENSLMRDLRAETPDLNPYESREVFRAHYTKLRPTVKAPRAELVAFSTEVAESLGLSAAECETEAFLEFFSGSPPEAVDCWATVYGASFTGRYGGQRGDGRAISVGQVNGKEMQLKGGGITPYSRRSDGRAVLRSSVREFLAQEHMAALGIPTTRSLCLVATGEEVRRYWYTEEGSQSVMREPGAVGTRVATSFIRFGQMEIFSQRGDLKLLEELAEHALQREFPHLCGDAGQLSPHLLLRMFDEICRRQAMLVAEWARVGYCQGNMNSDNAAVGGVTLDYGPFAFMEKFELYYNPWTGGGYEYSFGMQPSAANTNLAGLGNAFARLAVHLNKAAATRTTDTEADAGDGKAGAAAPETAAAAALSNEEIVASLQRSVDSSFGNTFRERHGEACRAKLGLETWDESAQALWDELLLLMATKSGQRTGTPDASTVMEEAPPQLLGWRVPWAKAPATQQQEKEEEEAPTSGGVDFTLLFRSLSNVDASAHADDATEALLSLLRPAALEVPESWPQSHLDGWAAWSERYWARVAAEGRASDERRAEMLATNPKYVMRNWMAKSAYEAAANGDFTIVRELQQVLCRPYDEQSDEVENRWAQVTPRWARDKMGLTFMT
jgi:uncharacterized protein YdiU (UPF0061 family)